MIPSSAGLRKRSASIRISWRASGRLRRAHEGQRRQKRRWDRGRTMRSLPAESTSNGSCTACALERASAPASIISRSQRRVTPPRTSSGFSAGSRCSQSCQRARLWEMRLAPKAGRWKRSCPGAYSLPAPGRSRPRASKRPTHVGRRPKSSSKAGEQSTAALMLPGCSWRNRAAIRAPVECPRRTTRPWPWVRTTVSRKISRSAT